MDLNYIPASKNTSTFMQGYEFLRIMRLKAQMNWLIDLKNAVNIFFSHSGNIIGTFYFLQCKKAIVLGSSPDNAVITNDHIETEDAECGELLLATPTPVPEVGTGRYLQVDM